MRPDAQEFDPSVRLARASVFWTMLTSSVTVGHLRRGRALEDLLGFSGCSSMSAVHTLADARD